MEQYINLEYTNKNGKLCRERFSEIAHPDYLSSITQKMAFIVECYLTDHHADFTKPITIKYIPNSNG